MLFLRIFILSFATIMGAFELAPWITYILRGEQNALAETAQFLLRVFSEDNTYESDDIYGVAGFIMMFISASLAFGAASFVFDMCLSLLRRVIRRVS